MRDLNSKLEENIHTAINRTPGINDVSERDFCEAAIEAIDSVKFGIQMRLDELRQDELDERPELDD